MATKINTMDIDPNESFDQDMLEKRLGKDEFTPRQVRSLVFIVLTYMCIIPNRVFLASIANTLEADEDIKFTTTTFGTLAIIAGLSFAFGKLVNGILIDGRFCFKFMNEVSSMILFILASSFCVFMFSFGDGTAYFAVWSIPNAIVQAGTWPALAKLIYTIYEPAQFARVFAFMGIFSRIGATIARLYIGGLLLIFDDDWRMAVRAVSLLGCLGCVVFSYFVFQRLTDSDRVWFAFPYYSKLKEVFNIKTFDSMIEETNNDAGGKKNQEQIAHLANVVHRQLNCKNAKKQRELGDDDEEKKEMNELRQSVLKEITEDIDNETAVEKYTRLIINRRFLNIAFGVACLTILFALDGFSELLIDDVLDVKLNGFVTLVASAFPAGIVVALSLADFYVGKYAPSMQFESKYVRYTLMFNVGVIFCILVWIWTYYDSGPPSNDTFALVIIGILLFLFGYMIAYPYYVAPGVFGLRYGGQDAGQVTAFIDLFGFTIAAPFSYGGSIMSEEINNGWLWVWISLFVPLSVIVIVFWHFFYKYNIISEKKQELLMKKIEAEIAILTSGFTEYQKSISTVGTP